MSLEFSIRLTEMLLALAFIQQSLEHYFAGQGERRLFFVRGVLSTFLLTGFQPAWVCMALFINAAMMLHRFRGPYNGGSDRMGILILFILMLVHIMPSRYWQEYTFAYLALQALLSYFMAGWVKVINPEWRTGKALQDVFQFSAYPVSESLRGWTNYPRLLFSMSWAVMALELLIPVLFLGHMPLMIGLALAALFHFANACLFGLNRFFWVWLAAYPSIFWLQGRLIY